MFPPSTTDLQSLREALLAQVRQQNSLRQVIESISSELELRPLLSQIVRNACELLAADRGTIGLVDKERNVVRTEAVFKMPPGELGAEMPPGVGLAGQVFLTQQPLVLNRYSEVERPTQPDLFEDAVVGIPIFWRGRMIGFFGIGAAPPRRFSEQDVENLALFARHAAIAIENAQLFEEEKRRAAGKAAVSQIGQLITGSLSLDQILQTAVEAIFEHLHYHHIALLLVDPADPQTLVLRASSGIYAQSIVGEYRQSIEQGIVGAAARTHRRVLLADVRKDPRYIPIPGAPSICSELVVPVVIGDRLLGALNIEAEQPITAEDADGIQIIADQLGVAIENARLYAGSQTALDEMRLLYETSQRIGTAMDVDEVIAAYLDQVATRGQYTCNIALYEFDDTGQRTAVIVHGRWTPQAGLAHVHERHPYTRDGLDPLLDGGQTIHLADVNTDPRASPELREIQARDRRPALAMIPLMARGQRIGLVLLSSPSIHEWSETDLRLYQVTAAQLANALDTRLQQLRLYEQGQELAVWEERQRLARELHDSVTQMLFSMTLIAQSLAPAWQRDPAEGNRRVNRLLELSQTALTEMRALLTELRPAEFPERAAALPLLARVRRDGLVSALEQHAAEISRDGLNVVVDAHAYVPEEASTRTHEEALFRIAQEALNNVVKHASAQRVAIALRANEQSTHLTIDDDGIGFLTAPEGSGAISKRGGLGFMTMSERAHAFGGTFEVTSVPGKGTRIQVTIPRTAPI